MAGPIPTKKIPQLTALGAELQGPEQLEIWVANTSRRIDARDFVLPAVDPLITAVDFTSVLTMSRYLVQGPGVQFTDNGPGQSFEIAISGTGALPGDPTALVGLTPVLGIAPTWMRSDAAPALDQSIAPVWTGNHTFTANQNQVVNALPQWIFVESDAAADNRAWPIRISGEQFTIGALNDLGSVFTPWVTVDRTGTVIDIVNLQSTQLLWNGVPIAGGITGLANPTASVGLAAVNGAATTAMRSDGAPALSQAIIPTWTGIHTFAAATRGNRTAIVVAGTPQNLDLALGNTFHLTLQTNVTLTFSNPPAAGREATFTIYLLQDATGSRLVTWPASVHWSDGLTPVLTTTANRLDAVTLTTFDGGVTYYGGQVLANMVP